jgi:hypothetical protein
MFSDTVVASDVRRRDWSIGSLGTACVCSFSRPLRDIYSRCHYSPQRRREPAPRRMRRVIRGAESKCYCAPCPVDMSKWNTCHQYERCWCINEVTSFVVRGSHPGTDLSHLQNVQTGCEAHPTSCSRGAELKNEWNYISTPPICLHGVYRNNFACTFNHSLWVTQDFREPCFLFGSHEFTHLFIVGRYGDSLRVGRSGDRILVRARFSVPVEYGPGATPSLLHNGKRICFPGGKAAVTWRWPPTPSSAEVKERLELYLPLLPLWAFVAYFRVNITLTIKMR